MLARKPDGGWYDKEEFAIAIDEMRHGEHMVISVFVDGTPERVRDWPYGLGGISAIDAQALSAVDAHGRGRHGRGLSLPSNSDCSHLHTLLSP